MLLWRLKKLAVLWRPANSRHRRIPTTMYECMDNPPAPKEGYCRLWFIVIVFLAFVYYVCYVHFTDDDIMREMEMVDLSQLQRGEVPCGYNCNFNALSRNMKNKIREAFKDNPNEVPPCEINMLGLGELQVNTTLINVNLTKNQYPMVMLGGYYVPSDCQSRHKVAIIVPYRDQEANLNVFIFNIHPFLMNQGIEYRIFIIEQSGNQKFNEGRLFNVGFEQASRFGSWSCLVFHDINLLPLDARILYTCPTYPRHMSAAVLGHQNHSKYEHFGGVASMTEEQFFKVNGYSNELWGCCGISSDMFWRIRLMGLRVVRYDRNIARYLALPNTAKTRNYTDSSPRVPASHKTSPIEDGLSTLRYKVLTIRIRALFTHIVVDVNPSRKELNIYKYSTWKVNS